MEKRTINGSYSRTISLDRATVNTDSRTVEIAISSEMPVERWFGTEILGHSPGEVDLTRLLSGAPFLMDHNTCDQIGVVEEARLDGDHVLRGRVRFGRSERASEILQDVVDGIRSKISVGYQILDYLTTKGQQGAPDTIRATRWEPMEVSLVAIPADDSVGVGRSARAQRDCTNAACTDPECMNPSCEGDCTTDQKCSACTEAARSTTPGAARSLPTLPATPAGSTEVLMDPITVAAPAADPLAERQEALTIQALGESLGIGQQVREILTSTSDLSEARAKAMIVLGERAAKPLPGPGVDMSAKESREYSYARAILNSTLRSEGVKIERCFEDEVSDTIQKNLPQNYKSRGGVLVPFQTRAALDSATATSGAEFKYTQFGGELIELLRNYAAVIKMGARVFNGLNGPVSFPKQTGDATVGWVAENPGSDLTATAPATSSVTLSAKILQGAVPFSRSLLTQSVISVEQFVRESLAAGHALAVDKAGIHGTGANNQPTGIYRTTGINTVAMGGVPTYGKLVDMETEVAIDNALLNSLGWLTTPGMRGKLKQTLVASAAGSEMIWKGGLEGELNGYKAIATNQVAAAMNVLVDTGGSSHGIIFGNWADLMIGFWGALELVVDPYTLKKQGMIEVASYQMADVEVRHAASFCGATGATLS